MGCTCSTPEKAAPVQGPARKKSSASYIPPDPDTNNPPLKPSISLKEANKNLSTRNAVGDSFISVTISPRQKNDSDAPDCTGSLFKHAAARDDTIKRSPTIKPNYDSSSSFDAKEGIIQYSALHPRSGDVSSRDSTQRIELSFSHVSKPSIFGLPSITSDKNTLLKLHDAIHLNIPKQDETMSINASVSSFRGDTNRGLLLGDREKNHYLVPSVGNLLSPRSPRQLLLGVPEENSSEAGFTDRELFTQEGADSQREMLSVHNRLLEIAKLNEKNRYRRYDSMESKQANSDRTNTNSGELKPKKNSISAKGYKIEVTDVSQDKNPEEFHLKINDIEVQPDNKNLFKKPHPPSVDSPKSFSAKRAQATLGLPPLNIKEKILEETNESHSGGSRDSGRKVTSPPKTSPPKTSPFKGNLQTKAPLVKPVINITKEDTLKSHIKTKFRVNLLDIVIPKSPSVIPEKDEESSRQDTLHKENSNPTPLNNRAINIKEVKHTKKEENNYNNNLLTVHEKPLESPPISAMNKKPKFIPKPLDFQNLDLFAGPEIISPIYHVIKPSGGSTPVDSQGNSTFLKPLTITIDNIASVTDRHLNPNPDENISQFDLGKINFLDDGTGSPSGGLHPHVPLKKSMFGSKKNLFNKSKSVNFDEEGGLPKKPVSQVDNIPKSPNRTFLSPYDSRFSNDTQGSLKEVPSIQCLTADAKRSLFVRHRPKSQVIETPHVDKSIDEGGNKRLNQYIIGKELGRGSFGKVKLALHSETLAHCAIKIVNKAKLQKKVFAKDKSAYTQIQTEIAVMKKMDHPNIVKLHEVIDSKEEDKLYLVMEIVDKGAIMSNNYFEQEYNMEHREGLAGLRALPEYKARKYFRDLILGIDYMHNYANVIHRDIKPENLLIANDDTLKISDFNIAHMVEDSNDTVKTKGGTRAYMAPEAWTSNAFRGRPLDIWAAGATLYQFFYGAPPFFTTNPVELKRRILEDEIEFPDIDGVPEGAIELIRKCLMKRVQERITIQEIMQDPWLTDNGKEPLSNDEFDVIVANDEDIRRAFTSKLHATLFIATGLVRSLNSARRTLNSMHLDSLIMDKNDENNSDSKVA